MKCDGCQQEMLNHVACTFQAYSDTPDIPRVPYPAEETQDCHDCLTPPGGLHHPGCDMERCPRCKEQMLTCQCPPTVNQPTTVESPSVSASDRHEQIHSS